MTGRSLHIDTDPGLDDLVALALALASPELRVCAVTTVAGNAAIDAVTENAQRFLALIGRAIPVGRGAAGPCQLTRVDAEWYHGADGRRGIPIPALDRRPVPAAQQLLRESLEAGAKQLLALGPLTNVAELLTDRRDLFEGVTIVWMGGSLSGGNVTAEAEFNCYADPMAAERVLASGISLTVIGLDVTRQVRLCEQELGALRLADDDLGRLLRALLGAQIDAEGPLSGERCATLHDSTAVLATLPLDLFRFERKGLRVIAEEGAQRGRMLEDPTRPATVEYAVEVHVAAALSLFRERLVTLRAATSQ